MPDPQDTDPSARLERFAARLERALGGAVSVERSSPTDRASMVTFTPANPGALGVAWFEGVGQVTVWTAGGTGGRWELSASDRDLDLVEDIVQSVVEGRVSEVVGPSRSRVTVTLSSGRELSASGAAGLSGCVPLPFWTKWGRKTRYGPYSEDLTV
jgi:hypothetical protein